MRFGLMEVSARKSEVVVGSAKPRLIGMGDGRTFELFLVVSKCLADTADESIDYVRRSVVVFPSA